MNRNGQTPVAIIGSGPVGMALALFLERHGVPSVLFNVETELEMHPKGSTQNSRTMEHYRTLGLSAELRCLGVPRDQPTDVYYKTRVNGHTLARYAMSSEQESQAQVAASAADDQVPEPLLRANQMYVERHVFNHVRTRPLIDLKAGWTVTDIAETEEGVTIRAQGPGGESGEWLAQYAVGCDGGRSMVRRHLEISYEGHGPLDQEFFSGAMLATYVRVKGLYDDMLARQRAFQYWIFNPEQRGTFIALNGVDEFLMFTQLRSGDAIPSFENLAAQAKAVIGEDWPVEIIATKTWKAGVALVAEAFGRGRIQLAGDAVHLFTPTGGLGMNTGVEDAVNLAWKLAGTIQGWAGPDLLHSYQIERKQIAHRNTSQARLFASTLGTIPMDPALEEDSPTGTAARAKAGAALQALLEYEFATLGMQLGARYDGSPIIYADGAPPPDHPGVYTPSAVPGGRTPHLWLDEGRGLGSSLYDRLKPGFTLLVFEGAPEGNAGFQAAASARGIPLSVLNVPGSVGRRLYGRDFALVRPDGYLAWSGDGGDHNVTAILAGVTGHGKH